MSKPHYPWYPYIKNILRGYQNTTQKERDAIAEAMEAASPEARELVYSVYITRTKDLRGAAQDAFISYRTAHNRTSSVLKDIASRLGLLE